jgi:aspartate 1-decarboxylase
MIGDEIMVIAYVLLEPSEIKGHTPRIISINPKP